MGRRVRADRFGPIASKRRAQLAARALGDFDGDDLAAALPPLRAKLPRLARDLRFEDAARLRDRIGALEEVAGRVAELDRLRAEELCILAPAREPRFWRAFVVAGGRVTARTIPRGAAGRLELETPARRVDVAEPSLAPEDAADLLVVAGFLAQAAARAARRRTAARRDPRRVACEAWQDGVANFADRLGEAVTRKRSQLVVGLDPRLDLLPMELRGEAVLGRAAAASSVARFCKGIVDAVGPYVVAVKPQSAFFEALGSDGFRALEEVCDYARGAGLLVLLDAKRGDIGSTSRAYAAAFLEPARRRPAARRRDDREPVPGARLGGAVPRRLPSPRRRRVLPRPHVERRRGRRSGSRAVGRAAALEPRRGARARMGRAARRCERGCRASARSSGATHPRAVSEARRLLPQSPILLPGVGAQGATPADVARAFSAGRRARS